MQNIFITFLKLIRIKQWLKNVFIFAPLVFSHHLLNTYDIVKTIVIFFAFSLISVLVYIINDIHDCKQDSVHPRKKTRPIASGTISKPSALAIGLVAFLLGILLAYSTKEPMTLIPLTVYLFLNLLYTFFLKNVLVLDVFIIAIGFCIRVIVGAVVINVVPSQWIISTTFAVSLVLGFGKRRHELLSLKNDAGEHREILNEYTPRLLDIMIGTSSSITAISYMFYTMESGISGLFYTFPLVLYALFRYLYLIYDKNKGGRPEDDLFNDKGIIIAVILWGLMIIGILYYPTQAVI